MLHCALDASKVATLVDTRSENGLTVPPESMCYMEYDAVVVSEMDGSFSKIPPLSEFRRKYVVCVCACVRVEKVNFRVFVEKEQFSRKGIFYRGRCDHGAIALQRCKPNALLNLIARFVYSS